jgi:Predicted Zn-dependent protease (DUF2268)
MKQAILILFVLHLFLQGLPAQDNFTRDPDSALFVTSDIKNFWKAYDLFKKDSTVNPFGKYYIEPGSEGVKGFLPYRIIDAENLFTVVKKRSADYEAIRENSLKINQAEKPSRKYFHNLRNIYPEAVFPPVYFIIGAYNSGGTFNEDGLFIGAEMQNNIQQIPHIVAHELIHFQQKNWLENPTLLQQSITEGTADFLGEMISGKNINAAAMEYGNKNEDALCREFVTRMDSTNYSDWLYGVTGKDKRPNDLGYWMGYKISEHYYRNSTNKQQAIKEMLDVKDAKGYLAKSGYLKNYLK